MTSPKQQELHIYLILNIVDFLDTRASGRCPMNLALSVRPSVCNSRSQNWLIKFFWFFLHEVSHKVNVRRIQKVPKMKWRFCGFDKHLIYSYMCVLLEFESTSGCLTFYKTACLGKIWFLSYSSKTSINQNA